jgi:hypothetical protein
LYGRRSFSNSSSQAFGPIAQPRRKPARPSFETCASARGSDGGRAHP